MMFGFPNKPNFVEQANSLLVKRLFLPLHSLSADPASHRGVFILPDPKAAAECHRGLRSFVDAAVLLGGRAAHRESIGRDEHHVRGRALEQRAVKLLWREVGCHTSEVDAAKAVRRNAQPAPNREISRPKHGINSGWSGDSKQERSNHR